MGSSEFENLWAYPGEALLQNYKGQDLLPQLMEELQEQLVKNEKLLVEFQQQNRDWNNLLL
ncbi:MAG: hypothetical protein PVG08_16175 [Desulfobacterales bacterium]